MATFDTLAVTTELVASGIERTQAESIARSIAKVQGEAVTKDYLDLRLSEMELRITNSINKEIGNLTKEINSLKLDSQFTKWTNKSILVLLGAITSALIKIAFFH